MERILVIDDEVRIQEVVQVCLETLGNWVVITASAGKEGLVKAELEQPDAILLDVSLPDIDGLTIFQQLQTNAATRHIPVILLTAKVQTSDRQQFDQIAVAGVIAKPFDALTLPEQVRSFLQGWMGHG
ncbi:MAG: response regulator [Leptolyngbyaceae cyanobacterium bins.59]|nr:response regulator [Leptolyngbyaceae cyanobacterium bins.59]